MQSQLYRTFGLLTAGYVGGMNIYNTPKPDINGIKEYRFLVGSSKPVLITLGNEAQRRLWYAKYLTVSGFKGFVYGITFPISVSIMIHDYYNYNRMYFNRHLTPCSSFLVDKPGN